MGEDGVTITLKPIDRACPLCGSQPYLISYDDKSYTVFCPNDDCPNSIVYYGRWDSIEKAGEVFFGNTDS